MAFKMKNKAVMKMAKMAGNNRTAMKLKAEDAAMKMKKQSAMKHIVKVGTKKGTEAPDAAGAYTHNQAHRDKKFDMNHQQISSPKKMKKGSAMDMGHSPKKMKKGSAMDMGHSPKKMKKNSPMKDNHFKSEMLDEVTVKPRKVSKMIADNYPRDKKIINYNLDDKGRRTGRFKTTKTGKRKRKDYLGDRKIQVSGKSGGGFVNRAKKEGLESAIMNTLPIRALRTLKEGIKSTINYPERHRDTAMYMKKKSAMKMKKKK